jgi:hypothetical protein
LTEEQDNYKIVNLSYTEQASVIVKAEDNDEAETAVYESFPDIPDLKILSIEDADPELVAEVKQSRLEKEAEGKVYN